MVSFVCVNPALGDKSESGATVGVASGKDIGLLTEAGMLLAGLAIKQNELYSHLSMLWGLKRTEVIKPKELSTVP